VAARHWQRLLRERVPIVRFARMIVPKKRSGRSPALSAAALDSATVFNNGMLLQVNSEQRKRLNINAVQFVQKS
jgi:hypothetical protein